jgi:hypothetical protein
MLPHSAELIVFALRRMKETPEESNIMNKNLPLLLALGLVAVGSCVSAKTIYEENTYFDPYYGPTTQVEKVHVHPTSRYYYYDNGPSVGGFVDRSVKTGVGVPAKAAKETFKAIF